MLVRGMAELSEQIQQLLAIRSFETGTEIGFYGEGDCECLSEDLPTLGGEREGVSPSIRRMWASPDQTTVFEIID